MSAADEPVGYMERTRHYYRALGYERDYLGAVRYRCRSRLSRSRCGIAVSP